jgi:hypothetical protein
MDEPVFTRPEQEPGDLTRTSWVSSRTFARAAKHRTPPVIFPIASFILDAPPRVRVRTLPDGSRTFARAAKHRTPPVILPIASFILDAPPRVRVRTLPDGEVWGNLDVDHGELR